MASSRRQARRCKLFSCFAYCICAVVFLVALAHASGLLEGHKEWLQLTRGSLALTAEAQLDDLRALLSTRASSLSSPEEQLRPPPPSSKQTSSPTDGGLQVDSNSSQVLGKSDTGVSLALGLAKPLGATSPVAGQPPQQRDEGGAVAANALSSQVQGPQKQSTAGDSSRDSSGSAADIASASPSDEKRRRYAAKYGFYIHAYAHPAAVFHQVRQVHKFFPGSPVYIMSDGGNSFAPFCKKENCTFKLCPPTNDRWHPWPFFRRFYDAAVSLNTEYVIMLEPDNTLHGPITRQPDHDVGGLFVRERGYGQWTYAEKLGQEIRPDFKWSKGAMKAGLCGGSYYRLEAVLDTFSDESVNRIDWNWLAERCSKEVFSSDIAMPYLFASRGWDVMPWNDSAQMNRDRDIPSTGPADAAFRHYSSGYPGGKPAYNLKLRPEDSKLFLPALPEHRRHDSVCQLCYSLEEYKKRFGSDDCTNRLPFHYSPLLKKRYKAV